MLREKVNGSDGALYKNCTIIIDGMSIRDQVVFDGKERYWGFVDYGAGPAGPSSEAARATEVLMFLAVGTIGHWKVLTSYFLIHGISGAAQGELLLEAVRKLHEVGVCCRAVTFDGHPTNKSTIRNLGGSLKPDNIVSFISHPIDDTIRIYFFFDVAHCIKLLRNTLHDYVAFLWPGEGYVRWEYGMKLNEIQEKEGLHAANKITKKHIQYQQKKCLLSWQHSTGVDQCQ